MKKHCCVAVICLLVISAAPAPAQPARENDSLEQLAADFWTWRAQHAPFSGDDVNRMERPSGVRDWSLKSIDERRKTVAAFETRWKHFNVTSWDVPKQVDYRLIGSALARIRWELDINSRWKRDPNFYIEQTLTAVVEALTVPGPYDAARSAEILARIENIPSILQQARNNLDQPPAPFTSAAIAQLRDIRPRLREMASSLQPSTTLDEKILNGATERAADAIEEFRQDLEKKLPSLPTKTALGRDAFLFFLRNVALVP